VKTATLSLSVPTDRVGTAADRVGALAESEGGFIAEAQRTTGDEQSARLTVRVPAARFESALAALRTVGRVTGSSVGGTDVTGSLVDLDARLRSLRVQEDALNALLRKANTVGETLQVAQAAGEVRTQIEQLAAQQAQLSDAADQATINVDVTGPRPGLGSYRPAPMLVRSVQRAGAGALAVVGGTIVVLGYAGPVGALLGALWLLYRGVSRRRRPKVAVA